MIRRDSVPFYQFSHVEFPNIVCLFQDVSGPILWTNTAGYAKIVLKPYRKSLQTKDDSDVVKSLEKTM